MDENDPQLLRQKLKMATEWHERAEAQLARLQRMPDQTRTLRQVTEPAVAIPLLHCYDEELLHKSSEIHRLETEISQLRKSLDGRAEDDKEVISSAQMAEQRAQVVAEEAKFRAAGISNENNHLKARIIELEAECQALKEKVHATMLSEQRLKDRLGLAEKQKEESQDLARTAEGHLQHCKNETAATKREAQGIKEQREDEQHAVESQKVQLHLMTKENDDKVQEIERLRNKMVQALKTASDNHTTHLKIVEEKHRSVVENLHEQIRAQEAGTMKLKAQLSRVQVVNNGSTAIVSPMAVVELHTRNAQEAELKRLYAENTSLQLQRDDAAFRVEQIQNEKRNELDKTLCDLRRELETVRARARDLEERNRRSDTDLTTSREQLRRATQEQQSAMHDAVEKSTKCSELESRIKELTRTISNLDQAKAEVDRDHREAIELARTMQKNLESSNESLKKEVHDQKEKGRAIQNEQQRALEVERANCRDASNKSTSQQRLLRDKDLEIQSLATKAERLAQGLNSHKQQIAILDERLNGMVLGEQQYRNDIRNMTLQVEQLRMEHTRVSRDRDRLAQDMGMMGNLQRRLATTA